MDEKSRKKAAKQFAADWAGRGYEKGDAQVFWTELLRDVVGVKKVSAACRFEYRTASGGFIDCFIPDAGVLVEQKALGVDLDKPEERQGRMVTPFEQALAYAESFPRNRQPRFIVVCNFGTFRVHDRDACARGELAQRYVEFSLEELGRSPHLLDFITDPANSRAEKEKRVSMEAGRLIGELHSLLQAQYIDPESAESQKALNILCVRLVFCLFCEDAELFPKDAFLDYLRKVEPENMRTALKRLFRALDTPLPERDPYDETVRPFPCVNGGLFSEDAEIPNFTQEIKHKLLFEVSQQTDWSAISPTIFGGIFESTLNPETRRAGGMHYTSPENIHKVIDPLFLDCLQAELDAIRAEEGQTPRKRKNALRRFRKKLASLKFLDPACGSGNFLTETYLSLRRLEDDVLSELNDGQVEIAFGEEADEAEDRVRLSQFHGIEVNDFAVRVAQTAMWIAQLQANNETDMLLDVDAEDFPLRDSANIVEANALRIDWNDVLPAAECSYVMGNPPFLGARTMDAEQKADLQAVLAGVRNSHDVDYVGGWYVKCAELMRLNPQIRAALVSTNSICQGTQPGNLWAHLIKEMGVSIDFAWRTFVWNNEATDQAHVHCVIVGFSEAARGDVPKIVFSSGGEMTEAPNINAYLLPSPDVFLEDRKHPLCDVPEMANGNQPRDGGHFVLKPEERDDILSREPGLERFIRPYIGSEEFIKGKDRYCIWLEDASPEEIAASPELSARVKAVYEFRMASKAKTTNGYAKTPALFAQRPQKQGVDFLLLPRVSSEKRLYLPIGYMDKSVVASDAAQVIPDATLYHFGILTSQFHNAWMRVVAGRLESRYRYSKEIVYNCFPWPSPSDSAKKLIEDRAKGVLEARGAHPDAAMKDLYDPDKAMIFSDLARAHRKLDAAVEAAYGVDFDGDEEKIVAHLFKLYVELTEGE